MDLIKLLVMLVSLPMIFVMVVIAGTIIVKEMGIGLLVGIPTIIVVTVAVWIGFLKISGANE